MSRLSCPKKIGYWQRKQKNIHFIINNAEGALADKITDKVGKDQVIGILPFSYSVQEKGLLGEALDANSLDVATVARFILRALSEDRGTVGL